MIVNNNLLGYYLVEGKIFNDKIQAILYANENKRPIDFNFFKEVFGALNWNEEPETSLDEFYKIRAQQLRDKYDYLIAFCSGGADSCQMALSFLKNGIRLDEIYAAAPLTGLKSFQVNNKNNHATNTVSETFYAQMPFLEEVKSKYPDVKITVNDYFEDILEYKEDDWLFNSSDWIHPTTVARYSLEKFEHIKKLVDKGKRVAALYGNNKPHVAIENNKFICAIEDLSLNVARPAFINHEVALEPFFTTPDLPLLLVKQAWAVRRWALEPNQELRISMLKFKSDYRKGLASNWNNQIWNNGIYERAIVPTIYPSLNYNYFQALKPNSKILADMDAWFYDLHKDTKTYKMILSDVSNFVKAIDLMYFSTTVKSGFVHYRNVYEFGPALQVTC